ncbi:MAG TPA: hypothetical protein VGI20_12215 [Rhizomicrobium sp.]|jgi:hypothetical protein
MTDGPYAPLSMSRQWNEFGRALARPAFAEEAAPCLRHAVLSDARREQVGELVAFLKKALSPKEPDFFGDARKEALDVARNRFLAPMAQSALDHCEGALREGQQIGDAINQGAAACMRERARDSSNTIEAYLIRQEGVVTANVAQSRCDTLLPHTDWNALAEEIQSTAGPERDGHEHNRLEDGPPIGSP